MKKTMLIGKTGCGKTTLTQVLLGSEIVYKKTQTLQYHSSILDTPGEYLENRRFHNVLCNLSFKYDVILLVQSSIDEISLFPPKFATMFNDKQVFGLVTKVDLEDSNYNRAEKFLKEAGVDRIFKISSKENIGVNQLESVLQIRED